MFTCEARAHNEDEIVCLSSNAQTEARAHQLHTLYSKSITASVLEYSLGQHPPPSSSTPPSYVHPTCPPHALPPQQDNTHLVTT